MNRDNDAADRTVLPEPHIPDMSCDDVLGAVAAATGVPADRIVLCSDRLRDAVDARRVYCYLCRTLAGFSLPHIARTLIGSSQRASHSTVLDRIRHAEREAAENEQTARLLETCRGMAIASAQRRTTSTNPRIMR